MNPIKLFFRYIFLLVIVGLVSCVKPQEEVRDTIDLSGEWMYASDPNNEGMINNWSEGVFKDVVELPGIPENASSGAVWFSKKISIPDDWKDKSIRLILERTKHVMIWVDGQPAGESNLTYAPQTHDLTAWLTPGEHLITLRINPAQSVQFDPVLGSANTIMGAIKLEASSPTHLTAIYVTPNVETKNLRIKLHVANPPKQENLHIKVSMHYLLGDLTVNAASTTYRVQPDSTITLNFGIKGRMPLWDEFKQPMVRVTAQLSDETKTWNDAISTVLGLRTFSIDGAHYVMNGQKTVIRGYVESGQFLSNTSSMDEKTWIKRFETSKKEGFNFCRFISWCPPEAAFSAADKTGMFVQVDLPSNEQTNNTSTVKALLSEYGHHPSFVLFASGNLNWKQLSPNARKLSSPIPSLSIRSYPFYSVKKTANPLDKERTAASQLWAALFYRADIEAAFRNPGIAGYELSAFPPVQNDNTLSMNPFNREVVPLLVVEKRCWSQSESFGASVEVANYSNMSLTSTVKWLVSLPDGKTVKSGTVSRTLLKNGRVSNVGSIHFSLTTFNKPVRLNLTVLLDSTDYRNEYPIWVYPNATPQTSKSVMVSSILNKAVMNELEAGGKVLLLPTIRSIYANSLPGSFMPDVQVASTASLGTMGLLIQSKHPVFADFPTEFHSNWQWMTIVNTSRALNLSQLDSTYVPIVQVIDNPKRNLKLGMMCECKVGAGRLFICTSKLFEIMDKPEVVQLYNSVLNYMESSDFKPTYALSPERLKQLVSYTVTPIN